LPARSHAQNAANLNGTFSNTETTPSITGNVGGIGFGP